MDSMSLRVYNRVHQQDVNVGFWEHAARYTGGSALDLADTLWATPLNPFGERGDVWSMTSVEEKDYFERHKGLIEGTSAIAGGIMVAVGAETLIIPKIMEGLASSTFLSGTRLWQAGKSWNVASRSRMVLAQKMAAESGEAYGLLNKTGASFLMNRAAAGAAVALRTAPVEYAAMWNNEAFNSGDWSREGFWLGAAAVLGGTVGGVGGRAFARKIANSDEIRNLRSAPMTLAGVSNDLLDSSHLVDAAKINASAVELKESAYTTEFLVAARAANPGGLAEAPANATRLNKMRDVYADLAKDSMQKLVSKGISGVDTVRRQIADMPEVVHIVKATGKADPMLFHGLAEMGIVKSTIEEALAGRESFVKSLQGQAVAASKKGNKKEEARLLNSARVLGAQEAYGLLNGSWMAPDSALMKAAVEFDPEFAAARFIQPVKGTEGFKIVMPSRIMTLDASLTARDAAGHAINVSKLPLKERLVLNETAAKLIRKMASTKTGARFKLTDDGAKDWFTLDLAAAVLEKGGAIQFATTLGKKGALQTLDDIKRESLRLKAKEVISANNLAMASSKRQNKMHKGIDPEVRFRYNLPQQTAMERLEDPAGDTFAIWLGKAIGDTGTAQEFADALADSRAFAGLDLMRSAGTPVDDITGGLLKFNRDRDGNWLRPLVGYFDPRNRIEGIAQRGHANALTLRKAEKTAVLLKGQTHVSVLANNLSQMPELVQAMDVLGLNADQITGLGNALGQVVGEFLPRRFRYRDNPTLLAATKVQEMTEKHGLAVYKAMMESVGMQDIVTRVTSSGSAPQRAMLDQYFSLRSGWDIKETTPIGNGLYGFTLADTAGNRKRLGTPAGAKWQDPLMSNQRLGKDIVVDDAAMQFIDAFGKLTDGLREADNTLRKAKGLSEIERKGHYTPPPNTRDALVGFVFGPDNKLVSGRTIVARSAEEYDQLVKRTLKDLGKDSGHTIRSRDQLESLRDIWDDAQMDWIDPAMSAATSGIGSQTGGLVGAYVKQGAFNDALDWVRRKAIAQSQDTLRQMMDDSILVARAQGAAERVATSTKGRTIYDEYEMSVTGRSQQYLDTSLVDKRLRGIEESLNTIFANSAALNNAPVRWITNLAQQIGMNPGDLNGAKSFKTISDRMGPYTPFANQLEYLESRGITTPPTVRGMATKLNSMAASVLLRWFELPHAAMNMFGLMATIPATVMSGRAPISTFVKVGTENVGFLDGTKIMADAMKDMFSKRASADWDQMVRMGDSGQSVLEYHQQLGAVTSQAGFNKWFKEADKWASYLTDNTENWSRQYSHFVGLRLADHMGVKGMVARHDFAREIANSAIADYAPINRPELFASGFGSMLGLFQAYGLNHYTKMFRWMENGQFKLMGVQAGLQATMFGVPATYGLGSLLDLRDSVLATGSDPTAIDLIYEHYGPVLGGAIAHGSLSEVTQLALWTRGDMSFRIPGISGSLPVYDIGNKVARGFTEAVSGFMNAMPGEGRHAVLEAVQRNMPNRIMRSWMTLMNGGNEIDAYGQVMAETRSWMDIVARGVGVRSRRQQAELEAFYASRSAMERDAASMEKTREAFRSAVRNNSSDVAAINPIQYFNDYVKAGGNPRMFKTWARNIIRESDVSRSASQLSKSLTTQRSALETWRYGAYGAWDIMD